jgi:predicted nucleic acid-binding protein
MRVVLDTCVLYPTVLRQILIGVCAAGLARPAWSPRILEEWARAAARLGPGHGIVARNEIAALAAAWPDAGVGPDPATEAGLRLPDPADAHVLAAALAAGARVILTANLRDFPRRALAPHGIAAQHPDPWLLSLHDRDPGVVSRTVARVRAEAERLSGVPQPLRPLLKRAGLPRLGKRLDPGGTISPAGGSGRDL